ncbi:sugar transferase [Enterococcus gilvus]|uniref:sugar transferase n=1 Tax=Enterococcus gilvus TaxID=160453 RepID=UPI0028D5875C|nr:sugar transferase [Enterococcus gilvus]MDU5509438.1 sugar transferase [Enterococcus gilvus]
MDINAYSRMKRMMDIFFSSLGLLVCLPVFLLIAVLIKLDDYSSPILFFQMRVGKNGKIFKMYKFRTMVPDAEERLVELLEFNEIGGHMFKIKKDPRVTRIGMMLRKNSLDEFPQLVNVLKGEMSLVGPRPPLVCEFEKYNEIEKKRMEVIPGCTGLWQVSGRNSLSFDQMISLDMKYISNQCLKLDIMILLKTMIEVIKGENAY